MFKNSYGTKKATYLVQIIDVQRCIFGLAFFALGGTDWSSRCGHAERTIPTWGFSGSHPKNEPLPLAVKEERYCHNWEGHDMQKVPRGKTNQVSNEKSKHNEVLYRGNNQLTDRSWKLKD